MASQFKPAETPDAACVVPFTFTVTMADPLSTGTPTDNLGDTFAFSSGVPVS